MGLSRVHFEACWWLRKTQQETYSFPLCSGRKKLPMLPEHGGMDLQLQPLDSSTESHNKDEVLPATASAGTNCRGPSHGSLPLHKLLPLSQLPSDCGVFFSARAELLSHISTGLADS